MLLDSTEKDFQVVTSEPTPNFEDLAAMVLDNAGIIPTDHIWQANLAADIIEVQDMGHAAGNPALIEANDNEVMHKLIFNLPDTRLRNIIPPNPPVPQIDAENMPINKPEPVTP